MNRIATLLGKELAELRHNPGVFLPAAITGVVTMLLPFAIAIAVPYFAGERLSDSSDFDVAVRMYRGEIGAPALDPEGAIQAFIFQQFLLLVILTPMTGSTAIAAHSVIGEKQARTLEPLLATPVTTLELLAAKVLGALVPGLVVTVTCFALYLVGVAALARPGVFLALCTPRSLTVVFLLGPLATLAALQIAVCMSSRVNDVRSAQQLGALLVLPIAGLLVAQFMSSRQLLTLTTVPIIAAVLIAVNVALLWVGVRIFDRESILIRWR